MGGAVKVVTSTEDWHASLQNAGSKPVFVDFFADWCGPCKMIAPQFIKLAEENADKGVFLKVNVDDMPDVSTICNITAMPTFQVWKDGQLADTLVGANPDKLNQMIAKYTSQ